MQRKMEAGIRYVESFIGKDSVESILRKSQEAKKAVLGSGILYNPFIFCFTGKPENILR